MEELKVLEDWLKELEGDDPATIAKRRIVLKMIRELKERMES